MTRNNLISLIVLDILVMALAIGLIAYRYQAVTGLPVSAFKQEVKNPAPPAQPQQQISDDAVKAADKIAANEKTEPEAPAETRNVIFTYRNSKSKKVEIIGDFTNWVPRKMAKGSSHTWKITLALAPGDYAYNYVVDGKPKRDPNNAKVCNAGHGFPNSFLKVKPLANDNNKAD